MVRAAGQILDRVALMNNVVLRNVGTGVRIENRNAVTVESVSVISPEGRSLCQSAKIFRPQSTGDIIIGAVRPRRSTQLRDLPVVYLTNAFLRR